MKTFIKISLFIMIIAGVGLLILPPSWFPHFYDVRYMGAAAVVESFIIYFLPSLLKVSPHTADAERKNHAADVFQFLLAFIFLANALGDLGFYQLYKLGFEFDKVLHFFTPLISVTLFSVIVSERFAVKIPYAIAISVLFVLLCGVGWEVFEYLSDHLFKTHLAGVYGSDVSNDTKMDLLCDVCGSFIGTLYSIFNLIYKKTFPLTIFSPEKENARN